MSIILNNENGIAIVSVGGKLDTGGVAELEAEVQKILEEDQKALLFDFTDLEYINSSGLRILVMAYQRLKASNGQVAVCGTRDYIQEIFDISGYDKIFAMYPSKGDALSNI